MNRSIRSKWVPNALQVLAGVFILWILVSSLFGESFAPYSPLAVASSPLQAPSLEFWLGTDNLGRDVWSYTIVGARSTMFISVSAALVAFIVGVVVGSLSGYIGGWLDALLSRFVEFFQIVPAFVIALTAVAILGNSPLFVVVALAAGMWARMARLVRSQFIAYRERDFVANAKIQGVKAPEIIFRDIAPNVSAPIFVQFTLDVGLAALFYAGVTFLGMGDPNVANWGYMLNFGQHYLGQAPWISMAAGISIILTVLSFNLIADYLSRALDNRRTI